MRPALLNFDGVLEGNSYACVILATAWLTAVLIAVLHAAMAVTAVNTKSPKRAGGDAALPQHGVESSQPRGANRNRWRDSVGEKNQGIRAVVRPLAAAFGHRANRLFDFRV